VRIIHGVGRDGLTAAPAPLDCGNAGTAMRLLAGLLAGQGFGSTLVGDASLSRRPMRRVLEPLGRMGARIGASSEGTAPLRIELSGGLKAIDFDSPVASAQVKSAVLLAGLYADGTTRVREPHPTRDHSERILAAFGAPTIPVDGWISIRGGVALRATDISVPGDFSSAAFLLVAATLVRGSDLTLLGVGINPLRIGLLAALREMGADIELSDARVLGTEPVADLRVRHAPLRGIELPPALVPDMIDEFPILFVAAALAHGTTVVRGAAELRVKESDRIAAMARALGALGVRVEELPDGAVIHGGTLRGGSIDSHGDHRVAMAAAVAAQLAGGDVTIQDVANVATSFPGFDALARSCGMEIGAEG
jgi:3-phosphoshikimate 1-carboxyvinyltransferase